MAKNASFLKLGRGVSHPSHPNVVTIVSKFEQIFSIFLTCLMLQTVSKVIKNLSKSDNVFELLPVKVELGHMFSSLLRFQEEIHDFSLWLLKKFVNFLRQDDTAFSVKYFPREYSVSTVYYKMQAILFPVFIAVCFGINAQAGKFFLFLWNCFMKKVL